MASRNSFKVKGGGALRSTRPCAIGVACKGCVWQSTFHKDVNVSSYACNSQTSITERCTSEMPSSREHHHVDMLRLLHCQCQQCDSRHGGNCLLSGVLWVH
eukprot:1159426-Pelagomonas_calceolata.AAC.3